MLKHLSLAVAVLMAPLVSTALAQSVPSGAKPGIPDAPSTPGVTATVPDVTGKATGAIDKATGITGKATGKKAKATGAIDKATGVTGKATGAIDKATGVTGTTPGLNR
jgi:hypothetical protein